MALAMGIGRFAYTALLPSLKAGLGFDAAAGGAIASANLIGYLIGVLWARHTPHGRPRTWLIQSGLLLSVASTAAVAAVSGFPAWAGLRFVGGVASGLVFVLVSATVLEGLPSGAEPLAGILYAGVGIGIALSGATSAALSASPWQHAWIFLAALSAVLAVPAFFLSPAGGTKPVQPLATTSGSLTLRRLGVVYFLEGLGYIVSGTFAVAAVQQMPGLSAWAPWVWVAAGVAAAPSAIFWSRIARRVGSRKALVFAYAAQAAGMAVPALSHSAAAAVVGALLFGGTFVGIVTVLLDLARRLDPTSASRTIGSLTAVYGIGQAAGPLLAGWLTRAAGSPAPAVLSASAAVALGAMLLAAAE